MGGTLSKAIGLRWVLLKSSCPAEVIVDIDESFSGAKQPPIPFVIPSGASTLACGDVVQELKAVFGEGRLGPALKDGWMMPYDRLKPSTRYMYRKLPGHSNSMRTNGEWDLSKGSDRVQVLKILYGPYVDSAKGRSSLPGDRQGTDGSPMQPKSTLQPSSTPNFIKDIGQHWGHIEREELTMGTAEIMLRSFSNHASNSSRDMKLRDVFAGVLVNGRGGGKTHGLRVAPFDALDLMAAKPDLFAGYSMLDDLLNATRRTEQHRLAFMFDFLKDCKGPNDFATLDTASILAWCLLFSMLRSSTVGDTPDRFDLMLDLIDKQCYKHNGVVGGKHLDARAFRHSIFIWDVLALMRDVHGIPQDEKIGVFWAWDEALQLPQETLQSLCSALQVQALGTHCRDTWLLLTVASTISRSMNTEDGDRAGILATNSSKLHRYQLVPMFPLLLDQMMKLVEMTWKTVCPGRENYRLHETVQDWVALVEGNPRLLECMFAAASGKRAWNEVAIDELDIFFSRGVTSEGQAKSLLTLLLPMVESSGVLSENALRTACASDGRKWLLKLLAKCLLGAEVRGNEPIKTDFKCTYAMGQQMGMFGIRQVVPDPSSSHLLDPDDVRGTVHMPGVVIHMLYKQALLEERDHFTHQQPLLEQWDGILLQLLLNSRARECIDPGAVALRLDFLRVAEEKATVTMGELLPMKGKIREKFGDLKVITEYNLDPVFAQHQQLKTQATVPDGPALIIGQGKASEADSHLRLKLADEAGEIILIFQSKYHQAYGAGAESNIEGEYYKALVQDVPADKQLFVLCTDAATATMEGNPDNTVIICVDQHAAFYSAAGVLFRRLVSRVMRFTARTAVDLAAAHALRADAKPEHFKDLKRKLQALPKTELITFAQDKGVDVAATTPKLTTKVALAGHVIEVLKRRRTSG